MSEEARRFAALALRLQAEPGVPETVSGVLQFAVEAVDCRAACVWLAGRGGDVEVAHLLAAVALATAREEETLNRVGSTDPERERARAR